MADEPSSTHFARLLDRVRAAGSPVPKQLLDELVHDAYDRARRLTRSVIRGDVGLPPNIETDEILQISLFRFSQLFAEGLPRMPGSARELFAYIAQVIRGVAIDEVRSRTGAKYQTQFPTAGVPPDTPERAATPFNDLVHIRLTIQELLNGLPEEDRVLLDMRYTLGMTDREIAAEFGLDRSTISERIRKLMLTLAKRAGVSNRPPAAPPPDHPAEPDSSS